MHELGIAQGALDQAIETAKKTGATQIHQLKLRVGAMSGVVPDALAFAFECLREGTMAASASLKIETVPAIFWCSQCQAEFAAQELDYECPKCRQFSSEMRRGMELELASMEVS
jgi:hydrogenase nickel incorporation protein HypA/HybF